MTRFPEWAPTSLVSRRDQMLDSRALRQQMNDEMGELDDRGFCPHGIARQAKVDDKVFGALERLLASPDMEAAWKALGRPLESNDPFVRRNGMDVPWMLWFLVEKELESFYEQIDGANTAAVRRKNLKAAEGQAKKLLEVIGAAREVAVVARDVPARYLDRQNWQFREARGERIGWEETASPGVTRDADCAEFRCESWEDELEDERISRWSERALPRRLEFWASRAGEVSLQDHLQFFMEMIQVEAEREPRIKQPGRGEDALRPLLIKLLDWFMHKYFSQPLHDTVARIATAVLDLKTPLTRDDIRGYLATTRE
ncbi:MAG TPA: hypothetical protein VJ673_06545 [Aromatoleum sp.]|uniref:hypothetical protein n=1 Tax=Aromatoleum sp. TaxID=2307007 RepID=UPI002B4A8199|nr:hypothetical protein [Aromatoleum sp.]HJV25325.1 hypothetical protein [Aromatoleum sp.]